MKKSDIRHIARTLTRRIWIILGSLFLGIGILGALLPLLPTTPFLVLSAVCYARGSERFYNWLLNNKWFGNYIRNYLEGKGIPWKSKVATIALLWITIGCSAAFAVQSITIRMILIVIALGVTTHILFIHTLRQGKEIPQE